MTDSFSDIDDGVGRYASRTRVNRRVLTLTGDGTNSLNGTLDLNGKIAQIILDCTRVTCGSNTATGGSFSITMDIEDGDGDQDVISASASINAFICSLCSTTLQTFFSVMFHIR